MSNIEKLSKGVEVEWKKLGEVCEILTGGEAPSNAIKGSTPDIINKYPIYGNGVEVYGFTDSYRIDKDAVTISSIGANTGAIYFRKAFFTPIIRLKVVIPKYDNLLPRYIFHYLTSIKISSKKSSVPNMSAADVKSIPIPIPCPDDPEKSLEIQKEIVRILDKFSTLTATLTATLTVELQARKSQYEYYRNQLLAYPMEESDQPSLHSSRSVISIQNNDNSTQPLSASNLHTGNSVLQPRGKVEWKTLEQIFNIKNGYTPSKSNQEYWENGTIPWFRMEDIRENGRVLNKSIQYVNSCAIKGDKLFPANSIIVATSATIGEHALITVPFLSNQRFTNLSLKKEYADKFTIKFLFYYGFVLDEWCKNNITVGNFAGVDMIGFKKFLIPIPLLEEQERIVSILDKFDILTTSITDGLSKEIELRQRQYEYYRDMLLSFSKNNIKA